MELREIIKKLESEIELFKVEIESLEKENAKLRTLADRAEKIEHYLSQARDQFSVDHAGRFIIEGLIEGMHSHSLD